MRAKYPSHPSVFGERVGMGVSACQHQDQALALYALYKFVFSYAYRQTFPITSNIYEDSSLLRCDAVCIANFDYPENGGSKILQNVGNESPINTAPCLATSTKVWKTQIT